LGTSRACAPAAVDAANAQTTHASATALASMLDRQRRRPATDGAMQSPAWSERSARASPRASSISLHLSARNEDLLRGDALPGLAASPIWHTGRRAILRGLRSEPSRCSRRGRRRNWSAGNPVPEYVPDSADLPFLGTRRQDKIGLSKPKPAGGEGLVTRVTRSCWAPRHTPPATAPWRPPRTWFAARSRLRAARESDSLAELRAVGVTAPSLVYDVRGRARVKKRRRHGVSEWRQAAVRPGNRARGADRATSERCVQAVRSDAGPVGQPVRSTRITTLDASRCAGARRRCCARPRRTRAGRG
jgi:hypothetical protein